MAMKQTQTKMFDFSDVGLDFCAGSKNLFPDRFKKMLALGYNEQTVSSISVSGDQVTLNYGVSHGYVADRVLRVSTPKLSSINNGEFVIDSVTENTVTMTIDGAPASIAGNFTTVVASLAWELVYEQSNIHVYKIKSLDESDLFVRLCFQDNLNYRNRVSVCIGQSFDLDTGFISDDNSYATTRNCSTPVSFAWEFSQAANSTYNNYSYTQGFSVFGKGCVIGSLYHLAFLNNISATNNSMRINAVLPVFGHYTKLPMIIGDEGAPSGSGVVTALGAAASYIGDLKVLLNAHNTNLVNPTLESFLGNFYSENIDSFNTTSASPVFVYENNTGQFIGIVQSGFYRIHYKHNAAPFTMNNATAPIKTVDIDLGDVILIHGLANTSNQVSFFGFCVEKAKYGN